MREITSGQLGQTGPKGRLHRLPMVLVAASLAAGIAAGYALPLGVGFWAAAALAGCVVALVSFVRPHLHMLTAVAVGVAVAALGAVHVRMHFHSVPDNHIVTYTAEYSSLATVRGRIVSAPQIVEDPGRLLGYNRGPRTVFILSVEAIKTDSSWAEVTGLVRVTVNEPAPRLAAGQQVVAAGWIGRFRAPANPGQFDWARTARRQGLWTRLSVPAAGGVEIISGGRASWHSRAIWRLRASVRQHLHATGGRDEGDLLTALILGERSPALRELNETMVRAGIAHFLSISGLHLGVFLGFVYLACRLAMLSPRRAALAALAALACYLVLAEPRAPLLRSAIMATALCIATITRRRVSHLNALAVAAVVLLAASPAQLLTPGFQLSFTIVAGLILFTTPVRRWLFGAFIRRRGLMVFRGEHRVRRWAYYALANSLMGAVALSLTAYCMAAPLVAYHFGIFTPYAPLLSVLLLPMIAAVLVVGHLSTALLWPMPNLAHAMGRVAAGIADSLAWMISSLDHLPWLSFTLRPVSQLWVLLCYATLLIVLAARRVRFGRTLAATAVVVLIAATAWTQRTAPPPLTAELNLLAVGSGQCAVLRTPSGRTFLLDVGTQSGYDVTSRTLLPFLRARRLPPPRAAFISHANTDHYNGLPQLLGYGQLRTVYLNGYFGIANDHPAGPLSVRMLGQLADHHVDVVRLRRGQRVQLDDRTHVEVLFPGDDLPDATSVNNRSLVLRITCDDQSVLLTGDIKQDAMAALLLGDESLAADALVLPHHGSWVAALPTFVEAVNPRVVVQSSGRPPPIADSRRSRQEFFRSLGQRRRYYITADNGWIQVRFGRGRCEVSTMRLSEGRD